MFVLFPAPVQWHIHNSPKFDAQCDIAEQSEAKNLTEVLTLLSKQIHHDTLQLCGGNGGPITQQAIDDAERLSNKRFSQLTRYPVEKVRNTVSY
jgi:hypothetical protein